VRAFAGSSKKAIVSTPTGRALVHSLPEVATTPDMTAAREAAMRSITEGQQSLDAFLVRVAVQLRQLVDQGRARARSRWGKPAAAPTPAAHERCGG
jgi:DNA topoisomerase-3